MRKGWFKIAGVQDGDRSLEEQLRGVQPAIAEAQGARVLDLGCAEGLIAREFAQAGAAEVCGVEILSEHIAVAQKVCEGLPVWFVQGDLADLSDLGKWDIVLALAVVHKLHDPVVGLQYAARSSSKWVIVRLPLRGDPMRGILESKHSGKTVAVADVLQAEGFRLDASYAGARGEPVQHWRRA